MTEANVSMTVPGSDRAKSQVDPGVPVVVEETVLSLASFLMSLTARINRGNDANIQPVSIRAIPIKPPSNRKSYNGIVYFGLQDPNGRETIDASIAEKLIESVPWGVESTIVGLVNYRVNSGQIRPEIRIDSLRESGNGRLRSRGELEKRWAESIRRPKRKLVSAFNVDRPRIALVTGITSVAIDDIRSQVAGLEEFIDLIVIRIAMTQPTEVAAAIRNSIDANLLVLARGGGQDVASLDDEDVIDAVANSPIPVAVALGHATDRLILDTVADFSFPTPTAFGSWMRTTIEQRRAHLRQLEEAKSLGESRDLRTQLQQLQDSNTNLVKNLDKAAESRQEVETKLVGQQKTLLDQIDAIRAQTEAARKENDNLKLSLQRKELDQQELATLKDHQAVMQSNNAMLSKAVEQFQQELKNAGQSLIEERKRFEEAKVFREQVTQLSRENLELQKSLGSLGLEFDRAKQAADVEAIKFQSAQTQVVEAELLKSSNAGLQRLIDNLSRERESVAEIKKQTEGTARGNDRLTERVESLRDDLIQTRDQARSWRWAALIGFVVAVGALLIVILGMVLR